MNIIWKVSDLIIRMKAKSFLRHAINFCDILDAKEKQNLRDFSSSNKTLFYSKNSECIEYKRIQFRESYFDAFMMSGKIPSLLPT